MDKCPQQYDYLLMCCIKHVHGRSKMRGISFAARSFAVKCEDDRSDSTHCYLMIYCNSPTISICFVIRSLFPSSLQFHPTVYFLPSLYHMKELSSMLLVSEKKLIKKLSLE